MWSSYSRSLSTYVSLFHRSLLSLPLSHTLFFLCFSFLLHLLSPLVPDLYVCLLLFVFSVFSFIFARGFLLQ